MQIAATMGRLSVQVQMAVAAGALCVMLVLAASTGAAWFARQRTAELVSGHMADLAVAMAARLDHDMFERYREIGVLSGLEPLRDSWLGDPAVLRASLEQLQQGYPDYAWIGFADTSGKVRAATGSMLEGLSVAERPWFHGALNGPFVGDVHEAVLLAKLLGPRNDDEPFRFVDVAYPIRDRDGRLLGVLGAHLSWDWAAEARDVLLQESRLNGTRVAILDLNGRVLLGERRGHVLLDKNTMDRMAAQRRGVGIAFGAAPDQWLTGFAIARGYRDYPGLGWVVIAQQPTAVANAPIRNLITNTAGIGLLLSLAGMLAAWLLARRLTQPIRNLTMDADRIGRGLGTDTLPRAGGSHEVAQLSRALRSLLRRIGLAEEQLAHAAEDIASKNAEARKLSHDVERLRQLAETDPLTGLMNRRGFLDAAERLISLARRYNRAIGIVVVDIDHFKSVNDTHGHAVGDLAIRAVAERLKQAARDSDLVGRFGGEEFVVLLPETDAVATGAYAERVRSMIEASGIALPDAALLRLTVSLGYAVFLDSDEDVQDTIDRADVALYTAKSTGRNRVVFQQMPVPKHA